MKKYVRILFIVITLIGLTGCWNRRELNDLAIATALGIDKVDDEYRLTVQVLNPSEIAGDSQSNRAETITYEKTGRTLFEAARKMTTTSPRKIYMSHIRVVVIEEELAKEGIGKILDFISRDHEFRTDYFLVVTRNTSASNILKILTTLEKIPASKINKTLQASEKSWAPTKTVQLDELISSIVSKGKEPVLSGIYIKGSVEEGSKSSNVEQGTHVTEIHVDNIGAFKNDKLVGWLDQDESKGFNIITDNINSTVGTVECKDGLLTIETTRSKTNVTGEFKKGKPKINIEVVTEGNIGEVACKIDLSKPENIKKIEKKHENLQKKLMKAAIEKAQQDFQSDIFGFGEALHRANPKAWKKLEKNWDDHFSQLEVSIKVDVKIRRLGTITESFQKEIEE